MSRKPALSGQKILVGRGDPGLEIDPGRPPELAQPAGIEELPRRSVGLARVEFQRAAESDDSRHRAREVRDGAVFAASDVDEREVVGAAQNRVERIVRKVHHHHAGIGHVVAVKELAPRRARAPDHHAIEAAPPPFLPLAKTGALDPPATSATPPPPPQPPYT